MVGLSSGESRSSSQLFAALNAKIAVGVRLAGNAEGRRRGLHKSAVDRNGLNCRKNGCDLEEDELLSVAQPYSLRSNDAEDAQSSAVPKQSLLLDQTKARTF